MARPGEKAKEYRLQLVNIIKRYLDGDTSMITEIVGESCNGSSKELCKVCR